MTGIIRTDADDINFRKLVTLLDQEVQGRYGEAHAFIAQFNKLDKIRHVVVATYDGVPVGCGAIKEYTADIAEIKRMYVQEHLRGKGIALQVLAELEKWAAELGYTSCILETGKKQPEAIRLYQKGGYSVIPNYGQYENVAICVCMQKPLEKRTTEGNY